MPQLLALEWDQYEARVVVAQRRANELRIEHAFSVSLSPRDPGQTFADTNVGQRLESALAARHIGRAETIVAVGRSNIELRRLSLPPAPEDELPELVHFQAAGQFGNMGEDWPLDFFPIEAASSEGHDVLAATISPQVVEQITQTCASAGLQPTRLVLRPCAAASLLIERGGPATHRIRLFVDLLAEEADLTVLVEKRVVLMRTVRLPSHAEDQPTALLGEIRRTIAAAQNQLGGDRVEVVVLCGNPNDHPLLTAAITEKLKLAVEHFDPFARVPRSRELTSHPPDRPERFAPLLGLVLDEAESRRHAIDFLNPRKAAPPPNRRRLYTAIGAIAAVALLALVIAGWMELSSLESSRAALDKRSTELEKQIDPAKANIGKAALLDKWAGGNVNWLDELQELSSADNFPPAEDARLAKWAASTRDATGGRMVLEGHARDTAVIRDMESLLREEDNTVKSGVSQRDPADARYPWRFAETIEMDLAKPAASGREGGAR